MACDESMSLNLSQTCGVKCADSYVPANGTITCENGLDLVCELPSCTLPVRPEEYDLSALYGNLTIVGFDLQGVECSSQYVVFEREAREFRSFHFFMFQLRDLFPSFHFFMFQLRDLNQKNITPTHTATRKSTLERKVDYDENLIRASRSNTGITVTPRRVHAALTERKSC